MGIVGRTVAIFAEAAIDDRSAEVIFCWVIGLVPARPAPWNGDAPKKAVEELAYEKPVGKKRRNRYWLILSSFWKLLCISFICSKYAF